jgi:hypothetical protein
MREKPDSRARMRDEPRDTPEEDRPQPVFWHWFALAVLLFAWIAEATMCAERGF